LVAKSQHRDRADPSLLAISDGLTFWELSRMISHRPVAGRWAHGRCTAAPSLWLCFVLSFQQRLSEN